MSNYIRPFFSLLFTDPTTPHVYSSNVILGNEYLCIPYPCYHEILRRIAPFQFGRKCVSCIWTISLVLGWSPWMYLLVFMVTYGNFVQSNSVRAWELMGTYGSIWELMGTYGNLWELMGTYGNLWELSALELMGTYGNLWELMGTYGNLWELMGTYGNFVWSNSVRAWEFMGTYGSIWELIGTYANLWELSAE